MLQPVFCLTYPTCSYLWSSDTEKHLQFGEWNGGGICGGGDYVDDNYDDDDDDGDGDAAAADNDDGGNAHDDDDDFIQHIEQFALP